MKANLIHAVDPLEHFLGIYRSLRNDSWWPADREWMRFAAVSTAMRPANPEATANEIRNCAEALRLKAAWFEPLPAMLRIVVAAMLVQTGDRPELFDAALASTRGLMRGEKLPHRGDSDVLATLALRVLADGGEIPPVAVRRMADIYQAMNRHHRWLTDCDDVVACAVLTACGGSPIAIEGSAEVAFNLLRKAGLSVGQHLQAAANMLPLAGVSPDEAVERLLALIRAYAEVDSDVMPERWQALAMLSLLDHEPRLVIERYNRNLTELERLDPLLTYDVNANIAADLAFLDLARFDRHRRALTTPDEMERVRGLLRIQRAASLTLVRVGTMPIPVTDIPSPFLVNPITR